MSVRKALFAPGYVCTPEIWSGLAEGLLPEVDPILVAWPDGTDTVEQAADYLQRQIEQTKPEVLVGHSMGGALMLDLLAKGRVSPRLTVIVDTMVTHSPPEFFRNYVWDAGGPVEARVMRMIIGERPRFPALKDALAAWNTDTWPKAALETGAYFIYGGRGAASREEVLGHLAWPPELLTAHEARVSVVLGAAHFVMLEKPAEFYTTLGGILAGHPVVPEALRRADHTG